MDGNQRALVTVGVLASLPIACTLVGCDEAKEASAMDLSSRSRPLASTLGKAGESEKTAVATFGAGCFWSVEAAFRRVEGVLETSVGYSGGDFENPSYHQVCSGRTGHAEVVRVVYDPAKVSYERLLDVFWSCHDPTTRNRQGPDVGHQYRSVIFYHTDEQKDLAEASKERLDRSGRYRRPIVTEFVPAKEFYRAEEYHQQYLEKNSWGTCPVGKG